MLSLQEEVDRTILVQDILARVDAKRQRNAKARVRKHFIDGNHEDRLERYLGTGLQSAVGSLRGLHMDEVFHYKQRGFSSYRPYGDGIWLASNLFVYHGSFVGPVAGASVAKEVVSLGCSVIMGHTHRRAQIRFRQGQREHMGIEGGCLCQISAPYAPMTNWAHAITTVDKIDDRHWQAEVHDIITDENAGVVYTVFRGNKIEVPIDYDDGLSLPWRPDQVKNYQEDK